MMIPHNVHIQEFYLNNIFTYDLMQHNLNSFKYSQNRNELFQNLKTINAYHKKNYC